MQKMRGAKKLAAYLKQSGVPISESTIYRLMRTKQIPFSRPAPGLVIFDTGDINAWLDGKEGAS